MEGETASSPLRLTQGKGTGAKVPTNTTTQMRPTSRRPAGTGRSGHITDGWVQRHPPTSSVISTQMSHADQYIESPIRPSNAARPRGFCHRPVNP